MRKVTEVMDDAEGRMKELPLVTQAPAPRRVVPSPAPDSATLGLENKASFGRPPTIEMAALIGRMERAVLTMARFTDFMD